MVSLTSNYIQFTSFLIQFSLNSVKTQVLQFISKENMKNMPVSFGLFVFIER